MSSDPPSKQYNIHEAKTQFSKLIEAVERGEEVIIARDGRPVAKLSAVQQHKREYKFGLTAGQFTIPPDFDAPLPESVLSEFYDSPLFPPKGRSRSKLASANCSFARKSWF